MPTLTSRSACASLSERSLLRAAQHHDRRAEQLLFERYEPLLNAAVHRCRCPRGLDREDLGQEARVAFARAIARWEPAHGAFAAFAQTCVRNVLLNALDRAGAHKHRALNNACSLAALDASRPADSHPDVDQRAAGDPPAPLVAARPQPAALAAYADPEAAILAREQLRALARAMRLLTDWERTALRGTLNGASHRQLAATTAAVALAVRRGRAKLARAAQTAAVARPRACP